MLSLSLWTVYDHPSDYPTEFVARLWIVDDGVVRMTDEVLTAANLDELRERIQERDPNASAQLSRSPEDDPRIVEVWL